MRHSNIVINKPVLRPDATTVRNTTGQKTYSNKFDSLDENTKETVQQIQDLRALSKFSSTLKMNSEDRKFEKAPTPIIDAGSAVEIEN